MIKFAHQMQQEKEQSSWIEYTNSKGQKAWLEMKIPVDIPGPEVVEVKGKPAGEDSNLKDKVQRDRYARIRSSLPDSSSSEVIVMNCRAGDNVCESRSQPVARLPQIEVTVYRTTTIIVTSDVPSHNSQRILLGVAILLLFVLLLLVKRIRLRVSRRNLVDEEEAEMVVDWICELKRAEDKVPVESAQSEKTSEESRTNDSQVAEQDQQPGDVLTPTRHTVSVPTSTSYNQPSPSSFSSSTSSDSTIVAPSHSQFPTPRPLPTTRQTIHTQDHNIAQSRRVENKAFKAECVRYQREQDEKIKKRMALLGPFLAGRRAGRGKDLGIGMEREQQMESETQECDWVNVNKGRKNPA